MGHQSGQPNYGQAPMNGPMPGGNPSLGGANMPSMQGPAISVPMMQAMLAQMPGGAGPMGGLADSYMPGPQGMSPMAEQMARDPNRLPPTPTPGAGRMPMPGANPGAVPGMQRPPIAPPQSGAPPMRGMMPGAQPDPAMLAALSQMRGLPPGSHAGMAGGGPRTGAMGTGRPRSILDLLGASGRTGGHIGGDPTRRRV